MLNPSSLIQCLDFFEIFNKVIFQRAEMGFFFLILKFLCYFNLWLINRFGPPFLDDHFNCVYVHSLMFFFLDYVYLFDRDGLVEGISIKEVDEFCI